MRVSGVVFTVWAVGCAAPSNTPADKLQSPTDSGATDSGADDSGTPAGGEAWARLEGIYGSQYGEGIAATPGQDVVIVGSFENGIDLGDGGYASRGSDDILVATLSGTDGALAWNVVSGDGRSQVAADVAVAPDGSIYAAGWFEGELVTPVATLSSRGDADGFLARWSADGALAWALQLGGRADDRMRAVTADNSGACVGGFTQGGITGVGVDLSAGSLLDGVVVCVDAAGTPVWGTTLGEGDSTAPVLGIHMSADAVAATGYFTGEVDLGFGVEASVADRDAWVATWSRSGVPRSGQVWGAVGDQASYGVDIDASGVFTIVGTWAGGALPGGELPAGTDAFVATASATSVVSGAGDDVFLDLSRAADGRLAAVGSTSGALDGTVDHGDEDVLIVVFEDTTPVHTLRYGGPGADTARAVDWIGPDLLLTGTAVDGVDLGTGALTGSGDRDLFVARVPVP